MSVCRFTVFLGGAYCITIDAPFIRRSQVHFDRSWSFRSASVLDQSQQKCRFFRQNSNPQQIVSASAQEENLFFLSGSGKSAGKKLYNLISPSNRAICGGAKVQVTGHRSGHRWQATGHRSQATGQVTGHTKNNRILDKTVLDWRFTIQK